MSFAAVKSGSVAPENTKRIYVVDKPPIEGQRAMAKIPDEFNATVLHVLPGKCLKERVVPGKVDMRDHNKEDDRKHYEFAVDRRDSNGDAIDISPFRDYVLGPMEGRVLLIPSSGDPARVVREIEVDGDSFDEFYSHLPHRLKIVGASTN